MTYNIKGLWKFNTDVNCDIYVPNREDTATVSISFTSNNKSYTSFNFEYGSTYYMFYDYDYAYMGSWDEPNYQTIDFGDEYQEIDETFYSFITSSATPITGFIQKPIVINVTSPEGVTLATEKTIINQNIKVTIDENLTGGYSSGYNSGFADGQESITKNMEVIEKTVTGNGAIKLTDVSEVPHKIQVQISNENIDNISAVKVQRYGKNLFDKDNVTIQNQNTASYSKDGYNITTVGNAGGAESYSSGVINILLPAAIDVSRTTCVSVYVTLLEQGIHSNKVVLLGIEGVNKVLSNKTTALTLGVRTKISVNINSGNLDRLWLYLNNNKLLIELDTLQIEYSSTVTDYEPYIEPVEYTVNADGFTSIDSLYPSMTILADAHIAATYQQSYGMYRILTAINDNRQNNGARKDYSYIYFGYDSSWFYPRYNITPTNFGCAFRAMTGKPFDLAERLNECGVILDTSASTSFTWCFFSTSTITRIPELNTTGAASLSQMFYSCTGLHTIDKLILKDDGSQTFTDAFRSAIALENIVIEGVIGQNGFNTQYSTKLSKASITSIVNALSTTTSGLTVTFSLKAVKNAFETSTGAADGNTSAEWNALTATRSNWTFSLV